MNVVSWRSRKQPESHWTVRRVILTVRAVHCCLWQGSQASFLLVPSHGTVFRTLQESRCRWPCRFHHWWEHLKILMRSFCVALWRPSSPMQKKTWSWERPHFQTRCRFIVRLPAGHPSAAADSFLIDLCSITRFKTSCLICTWSCLTQSRWRSTKKTLKC